MIFFIFFFTFSFSIDLIYTQCNSFIKMTDILCRMDNLTTCNITISHLRMISCHSYSRTRVAIHNLMITMCKNYWIHQIIIIIIIIILLPSDLYILKQNTFSELPFILVLKFDHSFKVSMCFLLSYSFLMCTMHLPSYSLVILNITN